MTDKKRNTYEGTRPSHAVDGYASVAVESGNVSFNGTSTKALTEEGHGSFGAMLSAAPFDGAGDWPLGDPTREPIGNLTQQEYEAYKAALPAGGMTWGPRNLRLAHLVDAGAVFNGASEEEVEQNRKHVFTGRFGVKRKEDLENTGIADKIVAVITRKNYKALINMNALTIHSPAHLVISLLHVAWGQGLDAARKAAPEEKEETALEARALRRKLFYQNHMDDGLVLSLARGGGAPEYPFNQATIYECGHLQEWDSTPNMERVNLRHRTGTGLEWQANGDATLTVMGDNYVAVIGNNFIHAQGEVHIVAAGSVSIKSHGDTNITAANDLNLNVGGNMRVAVKGDLVEEVSGHKYTRVHRHHHHTVCGHYRVRASRDLEMMGTSATLASTKKDVNVSAAKNFQLAATDLADLAAGYRVKLQSGGMIDITAKDDMNIYTSASFQLEAGWDVTTKAFRDLVLNTEKGEMHLTAHAMFRLQSRNDKLWSDAKFGVSYITNSGSFTIYAENGISTMTGQEGNTEIRSGRDTKIVSAAHNLFASAGLTHIQSMGDIYNTYGGMMHVYHIPSPATGNGGYDDSIGQGKEEKPDKYVGENAGISPYGKVCARDLEPPSRSSIMKHDEGLADVFRLYPVYNGENRTFVIRADENNPTLWATNKNKQEEATPPVDVEKYEGKIKEDRKKLFEIVRKADTDKNEDDETLFSVFLKGIGDRTNDGGVFANDCEIGEASKGVVKRDDGEERAQPSSDPVLQQSREDEEVPPGLQPGSPDTEKRGWFWLWGDRNWQQGSGCQYVYRGKIRTNVPYPLVDTTNYTAATETCVNSYDAQPSGELAGTAHVFTEPYWRKDVFRAQLVNYFPGGDQKSSDRLSFEMHCAHVNNDREVLEESNKHIWTTGGMNHVGGVRPQLRDGELSLRSADRAGDRKHMRSIEVSYKADEFMHFEQAPEDPRKKPMEHLEKRKQELLKNKGDRGIKPEDSDYDKIRNAEENK